jgi:hypothetical protein
MRKRHDIGHGRFEAVNHGGQVAIFNRRCPRTDRCGNPVPLAVLPCDAEDDHRVCREAMDWLRDQGQISPVQYYRYLEDFTARDFF